MLRRDAAGDIDDHGLDLPEDLAYIEALVAIVSRLAEEADVIGQLRGFSLRPGRVLEGGLTDVENGLLGRREVDVLEGFKTSTYFSLDLVELIVERYRIRDAFLRLLVTLRPLLLVAYLKCLKANRYFCSIVLFYEVPINCQMPGR